MASELDNLLKKINKKYDDEIATIGLPEKHIRRIPFTSPSANWLTYGGVPRGRIIEFAGEEGSGKTTTALDIVKNAQEIFEEEGSKKRVVYVDCENTLDIDWATKLGVDVTNLVLIKPQTQSAEEIFQIALDMIETNEVGLMVIDSLGVMVSSQALDKTMEEKTYGGISQALTTFANKASSLCAKYDTTLIGINQVREDMSNPYNQFKTPGGKAWKHMCSLRIIFNKGYPIDENGNELKKSALNPFGNRVQMSIAKTKVSNPTRRISFYSLTYTSGIMDIVDLVDTAILENVILQAGSWFTLTNPETGEIQEDVLKVQGKPNIVCKLAEDSQLKQLVESYINYKEAL